MVDGNYFLGKARFTTVLLIVGLAMTPLASADTEAGGSSCEDEKVPAFEDALEVAGGQAALGIDGALMLFNEMVGNPCGWDILDPSSYPSAQDGGQSGLPMALPDSPAPSTNAEACLGTPANGGVQLTIRVSSPASPIPDVEPDGLYDGTAIGNLIAGPTPGSRVGGVVNLEGPLLGLHTALEIGTIAKVAIPVLAYAYVYCGEVTADICYNDLCVEAGTELTCAGEGTGYLRPVPGVTMYFRSYARSVFPCVLDAEALHLTGPDPSELVDYTCNQVNGVLGGGTTTQAQTCLDVGGVDPNPWVDFACDTVNGVLGGGTTTQAQTCIDAGGVNPKPLVDYACNTVSNVLGGGTTTQHRYALKPDGLLDGEPAYAREGTGFHYIHETIPCAGSLEARLT